MVCMVAHMIIWRSVWSVWRSVWPLGRQFDGLSGLRSVSMTVSAVRLPHSSLLRVKRNSTGDPAFSMYNLSLRSDWADSADQFCHRLQSSDDESDEEAVYDVRKAHERLIHVSESDSVESF